jgi:hypothetical protein
MIKSIRVQIDGEHEACMRKEKKNHTGFRPRKLNETDHLIDTLRWGSNNKMDFEQIGLEYMDWSHLATNRNQWRAALNTAMQVQFFVNCRECLV